MSRRLTPALLKLLDDVLDTLEKLELARYLYRAEGDVRVATLQADLGLDRDLLRRVLAELDARQVTISTRPGSVGLGPRARRDDFLALMQLYGEDRLVVMGALSSIAIQRIRSMAARTFAESSALGPRKSADDVNERTDDDEESGK